MHRKLLKYIQDSDVAITVLLFAIAILSFSGVPDNIWDKGFDQLPIEIKDYISFIEERVDCKVTILSVGPQRHETIIR